MDEVRVIQLIFGLGKGGAETMLYNVIKYKNNDRITYKVISLGGSDYYAEGIKTFGAEVVFIDIKRKPIRSLIKSVIEIRKCDVLCCWMYNANLIGFISGKIAKAKKIIWCIRHSDLSKENNKKSTLLTSKICAKLSKYVDVIAYNGEEARKVHEEAGYDKSKSVVLLNGCDTETYIKKTNSKDYLAQTIDCDVQNKKIILSVSRYHIIKDIPNFVIAVATAKKSDNDIIAVMCGRNITDENKELTELIAGSGLKINKDVFLLGPREDLPELMSACDLYVLHSAGEAFPNTLIEAMACEANCVATDVGEVSRIVSAGISVVPPKDSKLLAEAVLAAINEDPVDKGNNAICNRETVINKFSIRNITNEYERLFLN